MRIRTACLTLLAAALAGCGGAGAPLPFGTRTTNPGSGATANPPVGGYLGGGLPANAILYTEEGTSSTTLRAIGSDGSGDRALASTGPTVQAFAFSPVSTDVVFAGATASNGYFGIYRNGALSLEGASRLVDPQYGAVFDIQITQDGRTVVFSATTDFNVTNIYAVNLSGGAVRQIGQGQSPSVSPDGQRVLYVSDSGGGTALFVCPLSGGSPTQLTSGGYLDSYPSWSRDGLKIAFCSNRSNPSFDIYTCNADGTGITAVTATTALSEVAPSFSEDGAWVCYSAQDDAQVAGGLYKIRADAASSGAQPVLLKGMQDAGVFTYWVSSTGRSLVRPSVPFHFRRRS